MLLDEWTADQDPELERKFHVELRLRLVRACKALIVVINDERYLSEPDLPSQWPHMDEGQIDEDNMGAG